MQGKVFLGTQKVAERDYAHAFRGRMDERIDLVRSVRDKKYRYIRNYMPHKIYGQYIEYLWRAPSMQSWEAAYKAGTLNETQRKFWEKKPAEELFDIAADPHNVKNLAGDPKYKAVLEKMRKANRDYLIDIKDVGFLPEAMMEETSNIIPLYDYARSGHYDVKKVIEVAELASLGDPSNISKIMKMLVDKDPIIRYWAATGCTILGARATPAKYDLLALLDDKEVSVRIAAAEALTHLGEKSKAVQALTTALSSDIQMARVQALNVLEQLGPDASASFPTVKKLLDEKKKNANYDLRAAEKIMMSAKQ